MLKRYTIPVEVERGGRAVCHLIHCDNEEAADFLMGALNAASKKPFKWRLGEYNLRYVLPPVEQFTQTNQ